MFFRLGYDQKYMTILDEFQSNYSLYLMEKINGDIK